MNILGIFLNNEIRTGGHIRCLELMEGLAERGDIVTVLLNSDLDYRPCHFSEVRLSAKYKRRSFPPASFVFAKATDAWLDMGGPRAKPDFILVFGETHFNSALVARKRLLAPIMIGLQSNAVREALISLKENALRPPKLARALVDLVHYRIYERRISHSCDAIIFQSPFDRDDFLSRNRDASKKTYIIGGHIGPPRFTPENQGLNSSTSMRKILFMGTLGERKGLRYLFDGFGILRDEGRRGLELHVAGPGTEKQRAWFEGYAASRGFADAVTFYGRVPSTFPLMASCDIMVAPSLFDSYPDVILLALHAGIPVVGSRVGGISAMLEADELLFAPRDGAAIASILRRCLDDPEHYARLRSLCASRRDIFHFDWPAAWEKVASETFGI
jgi:glycosyltransferase involved in cell wall biosynthesis